MESRTTRSTLPGATKLALLPKRTHGETVSAQLTLNLGDEQSLMNRKTAAGLAAAMLMRGTKTKTREQIKDAFDQLKARVNIFGGPSGVNVSIEAKRPQLPEVLKLVGEVLREPSFDEKDLEQLRRARLAHVRYTKSDPHSQAPVQFNWNPKPRRNR